MDQQFSSNNALFIDSNVYIPKSTKSDFLSYPLVDPSTTSYKSQL